MKESESESALEWHWEKVEFLSKLKETTGTDSENTSQMTFLKDGKLQLDGED